MTISTPGCDSGVEMQRAVLERCFPKLHRAMESLRERHEDGQIEDIDADELGGLEAALVAEFDGYIRSSWLASARNKRDR